jgi:hypothetical protein
MWIGSAARAAGSSRFAETRPRRLPHPLRDQAGHPVIVTAPGRPLRHSPAGLICCAWVST